jgi:hypothetical protein
MFSKMIDQPTTRVIEFANGQLSVKRVYPINPAISAVEVDGNCTNKKSGDYPEGLKPRCIG